MQNRCVAEALRSMRGAVAAISSASLLSQSTGAPPLSAMNSPSDRSSLLPPQLESAAKGAAGAAAAAAAAVVAVVGSSAPGTGADQVANLGGP